jgi:hypothetical protein
MPEEKKISLQFDEGFKAAKQVPEGGAMCSNCSKWNSKTQLCEGKSYIKWNGGSGKIPMDPDDYLCVWWKALPKSQWKDLK